MSTGTATEKLTEQRSLESIRCLAVPLRGMELLVPYTSIAEVTEYSEPGALANAPEWLLGLLRWRGTDVPLLSFERLVAAGPEASNETPAKVVIFNTLNGNRKLPFIAMPTAGIPRLTWVEKETLEETKPSEQLDQPAVLRSVRIPEGEFVIPDFDELEQMLHRLGI